MKKKNKYYSDGYVAHGLMETKHAIKELLGMMDQSYCEDDGSLLYPDYYEELFNCIDKAIELIGHNPVNKK